MERDGHWKFKASVVYAMSSRQETLSPNAPVLELFQISIRMIYFKGL